MICLSQSSVCCSAACPCLEAGLKRWPSCCQLCCFQRTASSCSSFAWLLYLKWGNQFEVEVFPAKPGAETRQCVNYNLFPVIAPVTSVAFAMYKEYLCYQTTCKGRSCLAALSCHCTLFSLNFLLPAQHGTLWLEQELVPSSVSSSFWAWLHLTFMLYNVLSAWKAHLEPSNWRWLYVLYKVQGLATAREKRGGEETEYCGTASGWSLIALNCFLSLQSLNLV